MPWKRICEISDVSEESTKKIDVDGVAVLVVNYGQGFRVIPPSCPHMEEPLEESGIVARCILTCAKHFWAWNLQTLQMQTPRESLSKYTIRKWKMA